MGFIESIIFLVKLKIQSELTLNYNFFRLDHDGFNNVYQHAKLFSNNWMN
jgi:hypothetical protein